MATRPPLSSVRRSRPKQGSPVVGVVIGVGAVVLAVALVLFLTRPWEKKAPVGTSPSGGSKRLPETKSAASAPDAKTSAVPGQSTSPAKEAKSASVAMATLADDSWRPPAVLPASVDVPAWMAAHASKPMTEADWELRTSGIHNSWFSETDVDAASKYLITWGPLGIRTRMHNAAWGGYPGFRALFPAPLLDPTGELVANCFEVVSVLPGSPAEGHLLPGDLLLSLDGQSFVDAQAWHPERRWQYQERRGLELQAAELLDQAEGRGQVNFRLLRPPAWKTAATTNVLTGAAGAEGPVEVDATGTCRIRWTVEAKGDRNDYAWANWLEPQALVGGKWVDLSTVAPTQATTGWGKIEQGKDVGGAAIARAGKPVPASWGVHANSVIELALPKGATRARAVLQRGHARGVPFSGRIELMPVWDLPAAPQVYRKVLSKRFWSNADRAQPLEVKQPLRGGEHVRLIVGDGGNGNGSDGFDWKGMVLRQGIRQVPLHTLAAPRRTTGYGAIRVDEASNNWWVHANSTLEFEVPAGDWILEASGSPSGGGTVDVEVWVGKPGELPAGLSTKAQDIRFDIPKLGTYTPGKLPREDAKAANVVALTAAWLAAQQREDGSWLRLHGYTSNHYDTAWAGLGLMATGDKQWDPQIRRAAEYCAFHAPVDGWAVPSAMALLFLCEYWLRYRDDRVLPAMQVWVDRLCGECLSPDMIAGHGHNLGYRGGSVSVGGSHMVLALALAMRTPVQVPAGVVDGMLARSQELAPDGQVPYGRFRGEVSFEPNLKDGATYSGRHGPTLLASLIHGGPELFTRNCETMYAKGPVGGADQGHATQTLSMMWTFPATAAFDEVAYLRHLDSLRWKITMLRGYDGGFLQNAYRLEYQGGEGLLDFNLRAGGYLVMLCADRHNLAITGDPRRLARNLTPLIPTSDRDAIVHGYYMRNWKVAAAALGDRAPAALRVGADALAGMPRGAGLHRRLFEWLEHEAPVAAKAILADERIEKNLRAQVAEMVLGLDLRIEVKPMVKDDKPVPGKFEVVVQVQHPFAARCDAVPDEERKAWAKRQLLPMEGTLTLDDPSRRLGQAVSVALDDKGLRLDNWHVTEHRVAVDLAEKTAFDLDACIHYQAGDLAFDYVRPVRFNQPETFGNGEKEREITCDRTVWVRGVLLRDQRRHDLSFALSDGTRIATAPQGGAARVRENGATWITPDDRTLVAGSECEFGYTSGWQGLEGRVGEVRLLRSGRSAVGLGGLTVSGATVSGDLTALARGEAAKVALAFNADAKEAVVEIPLRASTWVDAVDVRGSLRDVRVRIEAQEEGQWKTVWWGRDAFLLCDVVDAKTDRMRLVIERNGDRPKQVELSWLRLFAPESGR